ncbi:PD-(D/E)XK nuclease family protein [Candidatus Dojkabacteria bacterium]|nr:PD-(D/E)XK nuclease family protein [Candidatus Dojkabacteria bacterium]
MTDKYTATWVSHSSISDFLQCPRAYYLKNVYKNPETGNKIQIASPPLSRGSAVHEVIESLSNLPVKRRFETPLTEKFDKIWKKYSGKIGGFSNKETEAKYKRSGEEMLRRVTQNPGPLLKLAVKIKMDLPHYWLSEEDDIILCGKIDWLEYDENNDSVRIIDFKTSKHENSGSLQLPIYSLLASNCQSHTVQSAAYWYIARNDKPKNIKLPDIDKTQKKILSIAKKIRLAKQLESFSCPKDSGCKSCRPYEAVLRGEAEHVGTDSIGRDIFILEGKTEDLEKESVIL